MGPRSSMRLSLKSAGRNAPQGRAKRRHSVGHVLLVRTLRHTATVAVGQIGRRRRVTPHQSAGTAREPAGGGPRWDARVALGIRREYATRGEAGER
jgi:hypothetical protein